jgi:Do/DeqQ family serine protease
MNKIAVVCFGFLGGLIGAVLVAQFQSKRVVLETTNGSQSGFSNVNYAAASMGSADFINASKVSTPSVVFIKTVTNQRAYQDPFNDFWSGMDFFGRRGPVSSSGSGVILTSDGYIVTNLHVIKNADQIEVIMNNNKQSYIATVIGSDASTDLALLKIEGANLPHIVLGNSDQVEVGEWVLAVGNPFNLASTVTAGIVSAKGRNINIVNNQFPIESFIQTDAAINPGNSGGALVNLEGKLIGINTAIASNTGSYNGYGFAIPVNIVAKIVKDLVEFKEVQRGFTGMDVKDVDAANAARLKLKDNHGVLVDKMLPEGPAELAGIRVGDLILKINDKNIDSKANFDEQIAYLRPNDKVAISYLRDGKAELSTIKLINKDANNAILKKGSIALDNLGAEFQPISKIEKDKLAINYGYRVSNIRQGRAAQMGIQEGFIITAVNRREFEKVEDLVKMLETARGQVSIEGVFPNGGRGVFSFYTY